MPARARTCYLATVLPSRAPPATRAQPSAKVMPTMPETLSKESFAEHLNTKFRVLHDVEGVPEFELELAEVVEFPTLTHSRSDVERFSLFFYGPANIYMPQSTYRLAHEQLGELEIFLVPVAQEPQGFRYEAVFSYYKEQS
jgi:hypothetical protein